MSDWELFSLRTVLLILESPAAGYRQASELWGRDPEKLFGREVFLKLLEEDFPSKVEAAVTTELLLARVLCGQRPGNLQRNVHFGTPTSPLPLVRGPILPHLGCISCFGSVFTSVQNRLFTRNDREVLVDVHHLAKWSGHCG